MFPIHYDLKFVVQCCAFGLYDIPVYVSDFMHSVQRFAITISYLGFTFSVSSMQTCYILKQKLKPTSL